MKILTANDQPHFKRQFDYRNFIQYQIAQRWGYVIPITWGVTKGQVSAYIIRSQWVADCPHCGTTSLVEITAPFFCPQCVMRDNGMLPAELIMPSNRAEIETLLVKRGNPDNRNWSLTETVEDLQRENKEHGVN